MSIKKLGENSIKEFMRLIKEAIPNALADLAGDAAHRTVTDTEKTNWNSKVIRTSETVVPGVTAIKIDPNANQTAAGGVPTGGTAGQILAKTSNTNYATGWIDYEPTPKVKISFIPVDNNADYVSGDCTLIQTPTKNILLDVGEYAVRGTVLQHLRRLGIERIDYLVLTHYHADHCGVHGSSGTASYTETSLSSLWDSDIDFSECIIILPCMPTWNNLWDDEKTVCKYVYDCVQDFIDEYNVTAVELGGDIVAENKYWDIDDTPTGDVPTFVDVKPDTLDHAVMWFANCSVTMHAYYPIQANEYRMRSINNYSTFIELTFGGSVATFPGDADISMQTNMMNNYTLHKADVYKMHHHAYEWDTYAAYMNAVSPKYTYIFADNWGYNLRVQPSKPNGSIARLRAIGCEIYNVTQSGLVSFISDGSEYLRADVSRPIDYGGTDGALIWDATENNGGNAWASGAKTVPAFSAYRDFLIVPSTGNTPILAHRYGTHISGASSIPASGGMDEYAVDLTISGDTLTLTYAKKITHTAGGSHSAVSALNINKIIGLR